MRFMIDLSQMNRWAGVPLYDPLGRCTSHIKGRSTHT